MAHTPLKMSIDETHAEVLHAWASSYSAEAIERAVDAVARRELDPYSAAERGYMLQHFRHSLQDYLMRNGRLPDGTEPSTYLFTTYNPPYPPTPQKRAWDLGASGWNRLVGRGEVEGGLYYSYLLYAFDGPGYAYLYRKVVRLAKGKPEMEIEHSLKNTGRLAIVSTVYNHNFVVLDKQPPGPDFTFKVPVETAGDCYARYQVRMVEFRESLKIVRQALDGLPEGPIVGKVPRLIKPPAGETYHANESPKGEIGFFIASDGKSTSPYRMRVRPPSFCNLQALPRLVRGHLVADVIAIIGTIDIVLGEVDR